MNVYLRSFLRNIELWLSFAGLVVILAVPQVLSPSNAAGFWKVAALTAIGVGVLHGGIFWVVRRRQRRVREQAIDEIREMLSDVVKNQLAIIDMYLPEGQNAEMVELELDGAKESIEMISEQVDSISEESLQDWKSKYSGAIENATNLEPA